MQFAHFSSGLVRNPPPWPCSGPSCISVRQGAARLPSSELSLPSCYDAVDSLPQREAVPATLLLGVVVFAPSALNFNCCLMKKRSVPAPGVATHSRERTDPNSSTGWGAEGDDTGAKLAPLPCSRRACPTAAVMFAYRKWTLLRQPSLEIPLQRQLPRG